MTLSVTELIGLLTAITALLGALGYGAVRNSKKEPSNPVVLPTRQDLDEHTSEISGLIRGLHQEVRLDHRDLRDKLTSIEVKLDMLRR